MVLWKLALTEVAKSNTVKSVAALYVDLLNCALSLPSDNAGIAVPFCPWHLLSACMKGEELTFVMAMDAFIDFFQAKISSRKRAVVRNHNSRELKVPRI